MIRIKTQMDQVTQQNAALVEEAAAAAGSLEEQAGSLVKTVSVFDLGSSSPNGFESDVALARPAAGNRSPDAKSKPAEAGHRARPNVMQACAAAPHCLFRLLILGGEQADRQNFQPNNFR